MSARFDPAVPEEKLVGFVGANGGGGETHEWLTV